MSPYVLLVIVTCFSCSKAIFCKIIGITNNEKSFFLLNFKCYIFALILSLIFYINKVPELFTLSTFSVLLSFFFAFFLFFTQFLQIKAMKSGPTALTTLICSCAFLIPIFYSTIFFNETLSIYQIIGLIILLISITLIVFEKNQSSISFKWFLLATLTMLCGGLTAVTQKIHQLSEYSHELDLLLIYGFFFCSIFCLLGHLVANKFQLKATTPKENTTFKSWLKKNYCALFLGVIAFCNSVINFSLSGKIPSVIQFPVTNTGSLILTYVLSMIIFKEKLKTKQKIGGVIGIFAILVIGLC